MSEQFKVGEIVEGCNHIYDTHLNGMECEIIGALQMRAGRAGGIGPINTGLKYLVRWSDGRVWNAHPRNLRRKPPADSNERTFMQKWRDMADKAPQRQGETA